MKANPLLTGQEMVELRDSGISRKEIAKRAKVGVWIVDKLLASARRGNKNTVANVPDAVNPVLTPALPQVQGVGIAQQRHYPSVIRRTTEYLYDNGETHLDIQTYSNSPNKTENK